jgi:hypothetical protein
MPEAMNVDINAWKATSKRLVIFYDAVSDRCGRDNGQNAHLPSWPVVRIRVRHGRDGIEFECSMPFKKILAMFLRQSGYLVSLQVGAVRICMLQLWIDSILFGIVKSSAFLHFRHNSPRRQKPSTRLNA